MAITGHNFAFRNHLEMELRIKADEMKKILIASILILLALPAGIAEAKDQASDEAAIRKVFADFAEAWGRDDAKSMASH